MAIGLGAELAAGGWGCGGGKFLAPSVKRRVSALECAVSGDALLYLPVDS